MQLRNRMLIKSFVFLILFSLLGAGCQSNPNFEEARSTVSIKQSAGTSVYQGYTIQSGDLLDIKFFYNKEFNEEGIPVRPDGRIVLQLGQELQASGLTTEELRKSLESVFSKTLKEPAITVIVREFADRIFVDGEVRHPGEQKVVGPVSALQAITRAGGATPSAQIDQVIVLRKGSSGKPLVFELNLEDALTGRDLTQDIMLAPKDIVYVPVLAIADVNRWVDTYIRKNIPFRLGLTFFDF